MPRVSNMRRISFLAGESNVDLAEALASAQEPKTMKQLMEEADPERIIAIIAAWDRSFKEQEDQIVTLSQQVNGLQEEFTRLEANYQAVDEERASLKGRVIDIQDDKNEWKTQRIQFRNEIVDLKHQLATIEGPGLVHVHDEHCQHPPEPRATREDTPRTTRSGGNRAERSEKMPDPDQFSGDQKTKAEQDTAYSVWKLKVTEKLEVNADRYPTESNRRAYAISRLTGHAGEYAT